MRDTAEWLPAQRPTTRFWFADRVIAVMQGVTVRMSGDAVKDAIGRRGGVQLHWLRETSSENAVQGGMTGNWACAAERGRQLGTTGVHAGSWVRTAPGEPIVSQWDNASYTGPSLSDLSRRRGYPRVRCSWGQIG